MARPKKNGLDYFSLDTDFFEDQKIKILQSKFGAEGVILYIKILTVAYKEYGYYFPTDEDSLLIIAGELNIDCEKIKDMIKFMVSKNLFSDDLYYRYGILTNIRMQNNYLTGTEKRSIIKFKSDYLLIDPMSEKSRNHRAEIYIDGKGCPKPQLRTAETQVKDGNYPESEKESESEKEKEKEKEKESEKEIISTDNFAETSTSETSLSNFIFIKNLFTSNTRIRDPNTEFHIKPILDFFKTIPVHLTENDIKACIITAFARLNKDSGVKMDYLITNIQRLISQKHEEKLQKLKEIELRQAEIDRKIERKEQFEKEQKERLKKIQDYKIFYENHQNLFSEREKMQLLKLLQENRLLEAGAIIEPKMEQVDLI